MTNLLVDTHVLLWALDDTDRLRTETRRTLANPDNEVFVSAATAWEMSIKALIGNCGRRLISKRSCGGCASLESSVGSARRCYSLST